MTCQVHTYFIPKRVVGLYIILLRDFETNRNEILARAEKLGWTCAAMTSSGVTFCGGYMQKKSEAQEGTGVTFDGTVPFSV